MPVYCLGPKEITEPNQQNAADPPVRGQSEKSSSKRVPEVWDVVDYIDKIIQVFVTNKRGQVAAFNKALSQR
jgi:hypothetical protein